MAPHRESFGPWTGKRESYLRTTPATLPRNFTTRTRRLQTEIIFLRSAGISLRRWSQTAGSMSALRPASPYLACGELRLQCRVSSGYPSHLPGPTGSASRRGSARNFPKGLGSSPLSCERSHFLRVLDEGAMPKRKKEAVGDVNRKLAPRPNLFLGPQVFEETMNQSMDIALGQREGDRK